MFIEEVIKDYAGSWADESGEIKLEIMEDGSLVFAKIENHSVFTHPASHYYGDYYGIDHGPIAYYYALKHKNGILCLVKLSKRGILRLPDEKYIRLNRI
jgi:hypothetical protein